ncbi:alpha/beta fold hydrolase [Streptomyces sp. NPDC018045]|uniref:alpha/beta fold hydrolase n=1 Tax=Streptomyces sp. NPDC018045 TaxID=3365037 RepID=UPI0037B12FF8
MTTFVLVSGGYTGGWIWREVADHLRAAGHRAHPVTLTGMGDRRHLSGPGTDLHTHIEDVAQVLDHEGAGEPHEAGETVLVAHCYGSYPALAAADRAPERIARLVFVDAGLPRDGHAVLDALPDPAVRDRLRRRAQEHGDGWRLPPPAFDETEIWGSLDGISEEGLDRLARLAAPQPLATLTQPVRLTGATAGLPSTGIFCTRNVTSTAAVRALVASGDPAFAGLADPRVGFFDLDTGHWPMLSRPGELADLLLRAAADEGERIGAPGR